MSVSQSFTIYNKNKHPKELLVVDDDLPEEISNIIGHINLFIRRAHRINIDFVDVSDNTIHLLCYRLVNSLYNYKKKSMEKLDKIYVSGKKITELPNFNLANNILEAMRLNDSPSNVVNSTIFLKHITKHLPKNVELSVFDRTNLTRNGFGGILGVNTGSSNEPLLIILKYKNTNVDPTIIVGKGVMFDAGGNNIKRGDFSDMKIDKCGAVYTYTLIKTLAENNVPGHFMGFLPLVENVIGRASIKPGDVISLYDKTTIEIKDTDAEGRIILADVLSYIKRHIKAKLIIDIATLTGQASYFFGNIGTAIMHNKPASSIIEPLINIGDMNTEFFWKIRLHNVYKKYLKSDVADLKNHNRENSAGVIFSGLFLKHFVDSKTPWIHFDIAGVAYKKHSTGEPLYSLYQYLTEIETLLSKTNS
jgi:leucyl aminopeptidase